MNDGEYGRLGQSGIRFVRALDNGSCLRGDVGFGDAKGNEKTDIKGRKRNDAMRKVDTCMVAVGKGDS